MVYRFTVLKNGGSFHGSMLNDGKDIAIFQVQIVAGKNQL
jgi:hypothetical protein